MITTTDNNLGKTLSDLHREKESLDKIYIDLSKIASIKINDLCKNNPSLLVFPNILNYYKDGFDDQVIFNLAGDSENLDNVKLTTGNLMGFISCGNTQVSITSRFADQDKEDYFLHYMLQKVGAIHLFDMPHSSDKDEVFDFMICLFPAMLKKAVSQGIFKTYKAFKRNDVNVKGVIDVARHIQKNIPFNWRIAYNSRERTLDNEITELIRHTIEMIKTKPFGKHILYDDPAMKSAVAAIIEATPSYNQFERQQIIAKNLKPFNHPYFTAYKPLQKLCLAILKHKKLKYKNDSKQVYGILFDGAWLWEEYLWTILIPKGFLHPKNKERSCGIRMFVDNEAQYFDKNYRKIYPDFYKENCWILDAKYKGLQNGVGREDLYQIVTYMHTMMIDNGGLLYPSNSPDDSKSRQWQLAGHGGTILICGMKIPTETADFNAFSEEMKDQENQLLDTITKRLIP